MMRVPLVGRRAVAALPALLAATFTASVKPQWAAVAADTLVRDGMRAFSANRVEDAVALFDQAIADTPSRRPYLWQRGLALFYADRYADGAAQFAADVAVNPNDTEEQIWHLLCLARAEGGSLDAARKKALRVGADRRPVMRAAQALFVGSGGEESLAEYAASGDASSRFYAELYLALYNEAEGRTEVARRLMRVAVDSDYARGGGSADPMVALARVHERRRGWGG